MNNDNTTSSTEVTSTLPVATTETATTTIEVAGGKVRKVTPVKTIKKVTPVDTGKKPVNKPVNKKAKLGTEGSDKPAKPKPVKVVQTPEEVLAAREKELRKKYKRIVEGSIRKETDGLHAGKITVVIACATKNCLNTRRVATSDLFQVKFCEECIDAIRKNRRKAKKKAARKEAQAAKKELETASA